jgi:ribonuclease D
MTTSKLKNGTISIELISTQEKLIEMCKTLNKKKEIAFDTEFDRFKRGYGFKLLLIQIFDGKKCYLVDPLVKLSFKPLWSIFENKEICKVVYAGKEDVDLLKRNGCKPINLYDLQSTSILCNRAEKSFCKLIKSLLNIELDKTEQTSNWFKRPLSFSQLKYAANDVIYLLSLKSIFDEIVVKNPAIAEMVNEEHINLENVSTHNFTPKLSNKQKNTFLNKQQEKLLELKILVDIYAQKIDLPPSSLVEDKYLEAIILNPESFLLNPFEKGFSRRIKTNMNFSQEFMVIVANIDSSKTIEIAPSLRIKNENDKECKDELKKLRDSRLISFKEYIIGLFGENACSLISEGLSKRFSTKNINWEGAKTYQKNLYFNFPNHII